MTTTVTINAQSINNLDLSPVQTVIATWLQNNAMPSAVHEVTIATYEQQLRFNIDYPRESEDPRELSEIPEIRLWFIRLDTRYPWLPFLLDWTHELARYTAMLVPHQFSTKEGIQFNPEALEIFLMHKIFVLGDWMQQHDIPSQSRLKSFGQMLGYDLDEEIFEIF